MDFHQSPYSLQSAPFRNVRCKPRDPSRPTFDKVSAWADLVRSGDHEQNTVLNAGIPTTLDRGQVLASVSLLSLRWNWTVQAVRNFLTSLEKCEQIDLIRPNHGRCANIIAICNFDDQLAQSDALLATFNPTISRAKKPALREALPGTYRPEVWNKTGGRCTYCLVNLITDAGKSNSYHIDHVMPVSKGGGNDLTNLTPACQVCNSKKNNKSLVEFVAALISEGGKWAA